MKKKVSFTKDLQFPTMIGKITEITLEDNLKFIDQNNIEGSFFISGKYKMTEASRLEEDFSFNLPIEISVLENCELDTCKVTIDDFNYEVIDDDILRSNIDVLVEGREIIEEVDEVKEVEGFVDMEPEQEIVAVRSGSADSQAVSEKEIINESSTKNKEDISSIDKRNQDESKDNLGEANCTDKERECDGDSKEEKELEIPMKSEKEINKSKDEVVFEQSQLTKIENMPSLQPDKTMKTEVNALDQISNPNSLFSSLTDEADTFATYSIAILREGDTLEKVMDRYQINKEKLEEYNDLGTITLNSKIIIPTSINE